MGLFKKSLETENNIQFVCLENGLGAVDEIAASPEKWLNPLGLSQFLF